MAYGKISDTQWRVVRKHVDGLVIHDLGAHLCEHSLKLLELGAASVVAVDKEAMPFVDRRVSRVRTLFADYDGEIDVAFLAWPVNHYDRGLLRLAGAAKKVIYVGKNTDSSMAASPSFFHAMASRRVLDYVPEKPNALIVRGDPLAAPRKKLRGEEIAGANTYTRSMSFEEAEAEGS